MLRSATPPSATGHLQQCTHTESGGRTNREAFKRLDLLSPILRYDQKDCSFLSGRLKPSLWHIIRVDIQLLPVVARLSPGLSLSIYLRGSAMRPSEPVYHFNNLPRWQTLCERPKQGHKQRRVTAFLFGFCSAYLRHRSAGVFLGPCKYLVQL